MAKTKQKKADKKKAEKKADKKKAGKKAAKKAEKNGAKKTVRPTVIEKAEQSAAALKTVSQLPDGPVAADRFRRGRADRGRQVQDRSTYRTYATQYGWCALGVDYTRRWRSNAAGRSGP